MAVIVCVEDEPEIREDLVQVLSEAGHEVHAAGNGKDGLALIHSLEPDLILSDCLMPVMSGDEMLRALRRSGDQVSRVPFVFLSANAAKHVVSNFDLGIGPNAYVTKPVDFGRLLGIIDRLLG